MNLLKYGDTIGIISPSWVANQNDYEKYAKGIERLGFQAGIFTKILINILQV